MKMKKSVFYSLLALFVAAIVALDQWTKWLVEKNMTLGEDLPSVWGIFHIINTQNDGSAWGMLSGQTWLFLLMMALFIGLLGLMFWKKWMSKPAEMVCLAAILGGGLGNAIDRLFKDGLVTDMICLDFMRFPIFNIADCFITCGCIVLAVYVLFFDREEKKEAPPAQEET